MNINRTETLNRTKRRQMLNYALDTLEDADGFEDGVDWGTEVVEGLTLEELIGVCVAYEDEVSSTH